MLSLAIAAWSGYVVVECLCRWHDAKHGITGIYEFPADSVHRRHTCALCTEDTRGAS